MHCSLPAVNCYIQLSGQDQCYHIDVKINTLMFMFTRINLLSIEIRNNYETLSLQCVDSHNKVEVSQISTHIFLMVGGVDVIETVTH